MSARKTKVEQALRDVLSSMIARDVKDPRVTGAGLVSVTRVECNVDLSVAHVYVSVFGSGGGKRARSAAEVGARAIAGLTTAAGFLRGPAARAINLARPPELRFHLDQSVEVGLELTAIVRDDAARAAAAGRVAGEGAPVSAAGAGAADAGADGGAGDAADADADPDADLDDDSTTGHAPAVDPVDDDALALAGGADDDTTTSRAPVAARGDVDDEPTRDLGAADSEPTVLARPPGTRRREGES